MNETEIRDAMLPYALGDLDGPASAEIRQRLGRGCPICTSALSEAQKLLGLIPTSLPAEIPSPALKERVLSSVAKERPSRLVSAERAVTAIRQAQRRQVIYWSALPSAAAILFGLLWLQSGSVIAMKNTEVAIAGDALATVTAKLTANEQRLAALEAESGQAQAALARDLADTRAALDVLRAQQMRLVALAGVDAQSGGSARLFLDPATGRWLVLGAGLGALPPGRVYELWFITAEQKKVAAGLLAVDAHGDGHLRVEVPADLGEIAVAAITDEPGFVAVPTGSVRYAAKL